MRTAVVVGAGMAGLATAALCRVMRQPVKRLAAAAIAAAVYLTIVYALFNSANVAVPAVTPLLVLITCGGPVDGDHYRDNVVVVAEPV